MNEKLFNSNRNNCYNKKNNKLTFSQKKDNTIKSLSEVEFFLRDLKRFKNYIKLYKIIK